MSMDNKSDMYYNIGKKVMPRRIMRQRQKGVNYDEKK